MALLFPCHSCPHNPFSCARTAICVAWKQNGLQGRFVLKLTLTPPTIKINTTLCPPKVHPKQLTSFNSNSNLHWPKLRMILAYKQVFLAVVHLGQPLPGRYSGSSASQLQNQICSIISSFGNAGTNKTLTYHSTLQWKDIKTVKGSETRT